MTPCEHSGKRTACLDCTIGTSYDLASNIIAFFELATDDADRTEGASWYERANAVARSLDPEWHERAAGVLAALSPQLPWDLNVRLAHDAYRLQPRKPRGHYGIFCDRAHRILQGFAPLDVLGGAKVRAFFSLIVDPSDAWTVCVDRHAVACAVGRTLSQVERKVLDRKGAYERVADAYRKAAAELGLLPNVVQATCWVAWRRTHASGWADRDHQAWEVAQ